MPMSPDRRGPLRSPSRGRLQGLPSSSSGGGGSGSGSSSSRGYKVLCVSSLHPKASDDVVRDTLYREYKKYGDISVRVMHEPDERVAYVYFRNFDDARDARHARSRIILFDKPALVEPVYESRSSSSYQQQRRSITPPSSSSHPPSSSSYNRYRSRSPAFDSRDSRRDYRDDYHHHHHHHHSSSGGSSSNRDHGSSHHISSSSHHGHHRDYHDRQTSNPLSRSHSSTRQPHYPYSEAHHRRFTKDNRPGHGSGGDVNSSSSGNSNHHHHHNHHHQQHHQQNHHHQTVNKKDKFPNYLNHIPPEDDHLATRTLFTGNLELNITEEEMRRIFGRYGKLVDIDIKRPPPGTGNAYAFIRYENLDQAHRAKLELSGQYIGKFQCKIGYGKVNATPKVWVGGCGSWTTVSLLEREFDRFGVIQKIEYRKGDPYAYIYYESIEAAQAAVQEMRGFPLGGPDKRLRMDFADIDVTTTPTSTSSSSAQQPTSDRNRDYYSRTNNNNNNNSSSGSNTNTNNNNNSNNNDRGSYRRPYQDWQGKRQLEDQRESERPSRIRRVEGGGGGAGGDGSPEPSDGGRLSDSTENNGNVGIRSIAEIMKKSPKIWDGGLILKNSLFPTKLHLIEGNEDVVDSLKDESDKPHLKITQRLRLDRGKLDDVSKRMNGPNAHAVFLGVSDSSDVTHENPEIQSRPLRNLVSYLKQKEAAGVISLNNKDSGSNGVLYCFPPCPFSVDLLRREMPNIDDGGLKEDHLVIVVVCGNN